MSEQDKSTLREEQGSGLLRSVEPTGGKSYSMTATDTTDGGADAGKDADGSDKTGDADSSDATPDADGSDESEGDADGTDFGEDSDAGDATVDADGSDS